jgi:hypothetical protein
MAVLDTREVAAQQPRSPFDIALRKSSLPPVTPDHFTYIDLRFFLWHWFHTLQTRGYLTQQDNGAQAVSSFYIGKSTRT